MDNGERIWRIAVIITGPLVAANLAIAGWSFTKISDQQTDIAVIKNTIQSFPDRLVKLENLVESNRDRANRIERRLDIADSVREKADKSKE